MADFSRFGVDLLLYSTLADLTYGLKVAHFIPSVCWYKGTKAYVEIFFCRPDGEADGGRDGGAPLTNTRASPQCDPPRSAPSQRAGT